MHIKLNRSAVVTGALIGCALLSGCDAMAYRPFAPGNALNRDGNLFGAKQPTSAELAKADYGSPVSQDEAQKQVVAWMTLHLKDADSAKYQWGEVQKDFVKDAPIIGGAIYTGYVLRALVNAKNGYGGYVGFETYTFLFRDGRIARVYHNSGIPIN